MLCCQNLMVITRTITASCDSVEAVVIGWKIDELEGLYNN